jgi:hypothetical protein
MIEGKRDRLGGEKKRKETDGEQGQLQGLPPDPTPCELQETLATTAHVPHKLNGICIICQQYEATSLSPMCQLGGRGGGGLFGRR